MRYQHHENGVMQMPATFSHGHLFALPVPGRITERKLEQQAEWFFNKLDQVFLSDDFAMDQAEYDRRVASFRAYERACQIVD